MEHAGRIDVNEKRNNATASKQRDIRSLEKVIGSQPVNGDNVSAAC